MMNETSQSELVGMHAEDGYGTQELEKSPVRFSGYLCLLLGVASFFCTLGTPMLVVPLIAIALGLFALRRSDPDKPPMGTRAARIGLVLAAGFLACGIFLPYIKSRQLGRQAERFSRYYIEVVAQGNDELALELQKLHLNRLMESMSLQEHYRLNESARTALQEFGKKEGIGVVRRIGPKADWVLDRPTRVFTMYGRQMAECIWADPSGRNKLYCLMEYRKDHEGTGQWHMFTAQAYHAKVFADNIL